MGWHFGNLPYCTRSLAPVILFSMALHAKITGGEHCIRPARGSRRCHLPPERVHPVLWEMEWFAHLNHVRVVAELRLEPFL